MQKSWEPVYQVLSILVVPAGSPALLKGEENECRQLGYLPQMQGKERRT